MVVGFRPGRSLWKLRILSPDPCTTHARGWTRVPYTACVGLEFRQSPIRVENDGPEGLGIPLLLIVWYYDVQEDSDVVMSSQCVPSTYQID